tara:strand:- start:367 stop:807 length:441 start_codon:yes stop_codon:yes gene_type:complete
MAGINKVILIGHLGRDPEMRYTQNEVAVCSFSLATSETYRDRNSGEKVTQTEWHNIILWRGLAETAGKYIRKGSQVYIEGKLRTRKWEDQNGATRYTTEVVADTMQMLDKRDSSSAPTTTPSVTAQPTQSATDVSKKATEPDDLPF